MLITKEQQEALVAEYIKTNHTTDGYIGFIDGINATLELVNKIMGNEGNS
jgi:phage-related tail protein